MTLRDRLLGGVRFYRSPEGGDGGAGGGDAAAAAAAAAKGGGGDWTTSLDPDLRGVVTANGWKSPADAVKNYQELSRTLGADKVALPAADKDGNRDWTKFDFGKLGRPEAPDKYAFKDPDGYKATDTDKAFRSHMAPLLHKAGLAQWQVDILNEGMGGFTGQMAQQRAQDVEQRAGSAHDELVKTWGLAYDKNIDLANRAIRQFGGTPLVEKLKGAGILSPEGAVLDPLFAQTFAKIGEAVGEDGGGPAGEGASGSMTPDQAKQAIAAMDGDERISKILMGEAEGGKLHPEYKPLYEKRAALFRMAHPEKKDQAA